MQCLICDKATKFNNISSLFNYHIKIEHPNINQEQYHTNYLKLPLQSCKLCSKDIKFFRLSKPALNKYCSSKCCNSDPIKKLKEINTLKTKYGVSSQSELQKTKTIQEKTKESIKTKFGDSGLAHPDIINKIKETNLIRYGVEFASQSDSFKIKVKTNNLEKYGVEHVLQVDDFRNTKLSKNNRYNTFVDRINSTKDKLLNLYNIILIDYTQGSIKYHCNNCNTDTFNANRHNHLKLLNKHKMCLKLLTY